MSLDDWKGYEEFLQGDESSTEWLHITMQSTPDYLESHADAVSEVDCLIDDYLDGYGRPLREDLLEADIKYNTGGLK